MRLAILIILGIGFPLLAGCGESEPPALHVDKIRYWFEGDNLLVLNITITNQAAYVPEFAVVQITVTSDRARQIPGPRHGDDLEMASFVSDQYDLSGEKQYYRNDEHPTPNRFYDPAQIRENNLEYAGHAPRIYMQPGQTLTYELGLFIKEYYENFTGYYQLRAITDGGSGDMGRLESGCFNHNVPEFYGAPGGRPDCYYYVETGLDTDTGMNLFHGKYTGTPQLTYDPPPV